MAKQVNGESPLVGLQHRSREGEQQTVNLEMVLEVLTVKVKELEDDGRGICGRNLTGVYRRCEEGSRRPAG